MNSSFQPTTRHRPRVVVIGLDGVAFSFLRGQIAAGNLPTLAQLATDGELREAVSIQPPVSSVAWASFLTARNPGKHGIFGFVDRRPRTFDLYIPTASDLRAQTIWEILSRQGRRICSINVPLTYPPQPVNGIIVGDFLAPTLEGATYPPDLAQKLAAAGYTLDADPILAHEDLNRFTDEVFRVLAARVRAALELLRSESWDVFMLHIMETDRINHFLWRQFEENHPRYRERLLDFYRAVDAAVGQIAQAAGDDAVLLVLSDHGFCTARKAVFLNTWLVEAGWLRLRTPQGARPSPADMSEDSRAYCLDPSRLYLRVAGREPGGFIHLGPEYDTARDELAEALLSMCDPDDGKPVIRAVYRREELYRGVCFDQAADLVADPYEGYDLRGRFGMAHTFDPHQPQTGMHQFRDAFWLLRGAKFADDATPSITDGGATLLALAGADLPRDLDGIPRAT